MENGMVSVKWISYQTPNILIIKNNNNNIKGNTQREKYTNEENKI